MYQHLISILQIAKNQWLHICVDKIKNKHGKMMTFRNKDNKGLYVVSTKQSNEIRHIKKISFPAKF